MNRNEAPFLAVAGLIAVLAGCEERGEIRSYTVPSETPPATAPDTTESALAANGASSPTVLPDGVMAWDAPAGWARVANTIPMRFATLAARKGLTSFSGQTATFGTAWRRVWNTAVNRHSGRNVGYAAMTGPRM